MSRWTPQLPQDGNWSPLLTAWNVIVAEGKEIGVIWLERPAPCDVVADLGILIGIPEHRGHGIGLRAIQLAEMQAESKWNLERVRLRVRKGNQRAISCYERAGFRIVSASDKQVGEERISVLEMAHDLKKPNLPAAGKSGIASRLAFGDR